VVGLTTTGAAKNIRLLGLLAAKVVVIEEAAEVLEAHVITALSPSTSHVMMIATISS